MTIPNLPLLDPFSPTFRSDVDAFFQGQIQASINGLNTEIARINGLGAGSLSATSTTTLTIAPSGTVSLTIETGKGFAIGQAVLVASTASPGNWMAGQVISYDSATGALEVGVIAAGGAGSFSDWTISVTALVPGTPQLDSIVVLTSGTSWTCPDGVRKVVGYVEGASGPGGQGNGSISGAGGGGGGGVKFVADVTPGEAYTYTIASAPASGPGGASSITIDGETYQAGGGAPGGNHTSGGGSPGNGTPGTNRVAVRGNAGNSIGASGSNLGGTSAFGGSSGGAGAASSVTPGGAGRIILELYK